VTELDATPLAGHWTRRPTRRGVATALLGGVLLAAGGYWRYPGVLGLGGALLALAVLSFLSVLGRAPVSVRRSVWPLEVTRYGRCSGTLRIRRSGGLLPVTFDAVEQLAGNPVPISVPRLAAGRVTEVTYPIPTDRRGVLTVGPLQVGRRGIAGLAESRALLGGVVEVRVLPRILPVRGLPSGVRRGQVGADERVEHGGTDLVGLREYLPGDDLRRLHWATSARTGSLMVREDADPSLAHLAVLLDDRAASYVNADMEDAVEVAASLAVAAADSGHSVRLLSICGQLDLAESPRGGLAVSRHELVHRLAEVAAQDAQRQPEPLPATDRDIVLAITGELADPGPLLVEAGRAAVGVVAVVDHRSAGGPAPSPVVAAGQVTMLRGPGSEHLVRAWNTAVAR
jgi:uncharacterized protein (DUF58 family)